MNTRPDPGTKAPPFKASAIGGPFTSETTVSLKDFAGKHLVLYFYPKDDTPGCTTQACGIRDGFADLGQRAAVLGVSPDPIAKHAKFIEKYSLPFPLLADPDHAVAEAYGVWVEKSMYGKKYWGVERTTFLIDPKGKILDVFPKVKPAQHLAQVLAALS